MAKKQAAQKPKGFAHAVDPRMLTAEEEAKLPANKPAPANHGAAKAEEPATNQTKEAD